MATSPRPWTFRPSGDMRLNMDCGAFLDAEGVVVCHFGDAEMYYPAEGQAPNDEDVALILAAVNSYKGGDEA